MSEDRKATIMISHPQKEREREREEYGLTPLIVYTMMCVFL